MNTVHLQGIADHKHFAIPAGELQAGDTIVYNYGGTSTVKSVKPFKKSVRVVVLNHSDQKEYTAIYRQTRLVAVTPRPRDTISGYLAEKHEQEARDQAGER